MDFVKSVFSQDEDEPNDPLIDTNGGEGEATDPPQRPPNADRDPPPSETQGGGGGVSWGFGGLLKTISTRSESVMEMYRRDLEEFGSGLRKETEALKEAAARAVRDIPVSLEVAQGSLSSVTHAIDELGGSVWRGTAEIISQGKDALLAVESDSDASGQEGFSPAVRYSRFEARVMAIQGDQGTFLEEPEDADEYRRWRSEFRVAEKEEGIEGLCVDSGVLEGMLAKLVPQVVDSETFWCRYYYKIHKLKQAEDARAKLVKRAISGEEEDLSWEVDDDDDDVEEQAAKEVPKGGNEAAMKEENDISESRRDIAEITETLAPADGNSAGRTEVENVAEAPPSVGTEEVEAEGKVESFDKNVHSVEAPPTKSEDMLTPEVKVDEMESSRDGSASKMPNQPSTPKEDEIEWDEIEYLGDNDDKKVDTSASSLSKTDLHKKLIMAEEDEDLNWDIEDDEPAQP